MLRPRIIPCLLVHDKGLVKTQKFRKPKYVGDPINTVKIFNEKEVDELIVLDIDATVNNRKPDLPMIEQLAAECRMPLCYGGGIKTAEEAKSIFCLGVEKIAISSIAVENPAIVAQTAELVGNQSVIVVLDVKKRILSRRYDVWTHNGAVNTKKCPLELAKEFERLGAGEIVINSIDNDGMMKGYDWELIREMRETVSVPMTALGGAGSLDDIGRLINEHGIIGTAAGSLFVFKGVYRAVLVNYPDRAAKDALVMNHYQV
ncbi:MAG: AglZ/HisF2 family acetamidino modification protein [Victivallaceae bacterium]